MSHSTSQSSCKPLLGTMISEWYSPNAPRLLAVTGLDFAIVDCEHGAFDYASVGAMCACAAGMGFPLWVRVPGIVREPLLKYLDMGAAGIVVPMVETPEDAAAVVAHTRYAPVGKRGISTRRAHNGYASCDMGQYMAETNQRVQVLVQIETARGVDNANAIAAVPGLSGLLVGPNDLSADFGAFGEYNTPVMERALNVVADAAARARLASGIISSDKALLARCAQLGMSIFSWGSELSALHSVFTLAVKELSVLHSSPLKEGLRSWRETLSTPATGKMRP